MIYNKNNIKIINILVTSKQGISKEYTSVSSNKHLYKEKEICLSVGNRLKVLYLNFLNVNISKKKRYLESLGFKQSFIDYIFVLFLV